MFDKAVSKGHRLNKNQKLASAPSGTPLHKFKLKFKGAIAEPEGFLNVKIFVQSTAIHTKQQKCFFDHWMILSDQERMICTISLRRFYETLDVNVIELEVLPRIMNAVQDEFVKDYPNGVWFHIFGIYQLESYAFEMNYADYK